MDRIIAQTTEARLAGMHEKSLYDLLLSKHVALGEKSGSGSQSVIAPFTLVPRRNTLNFNYFQVEGRSVTWSEFTGDISAAGAASTNYGWIPSSAIILTVNAGTDGSPSGNANAP